MSTAQSRVPISSFSIVTRIASPSTVCVCFVVIKFRLTIHITKWAILSVAGDSIVPVGVFRSRGLPSKASILHEMKWRPTPFCCCRVQPFDFGFFSPPPLFKRVQSPCAVASVSRRVERRIPAWSCPSFPIKGKKKKTKTKQKRSKIQFPRLLTDGRSGKQSSDGQKDLFFFWLLLLLID